ncbi:hypothetical protein IEE87_27415 (plasmid) [Klebsiella pneumoniae]|nr:hypothetical protein IEE87_27415 [Klebsiella pneumoniae]
MEAGHGKARNVQKNKKMHRFLDKQPVVFMVLPNIFAYNKKLIKKSSKDGKVKKKNEAVNLANCCFQYFLIGTDSFCGNF